MGIYDSLQTIDQSSTKAKPEKIKDVKKTERKSVRKTERKTERFLTSPAKRPARRQSFEIYDDQMIKLKQLKREAEDEGKILPVSVVVREALDEYFKKLG